jgi:hypothetical protein
MWAVEAIESSVLVSPPCQAELQVLRRLNGLGCSGLMGIETYFKDQNSAAHCLVFRVPAATLRQRMCVGHDPVLPPVALGWG